MKSPQTIASMLCKQWQRGSKRVELMLGVQSDSNEDDGATNQRTENFRCSVFPIEMPIGLPKPNDIKNHAAEVKQHLQHWRGVEAQGTGEIVWTDKNYRSTGAAIAVPQSWRMVTMEQWAQATTLSDSRDVWREWQHYAQIMCCAALQRIAHLPLYVHFAEVLLRQRKLTLERTVEEVATACAVALELTPGCAQGAPLRALSVCGIDSKFFERHRTLVQLLLDTRFNGKASQLGLEIFLDASLYDGHWLLLADLDGGLLPFQQMRVRSDELRHWQPQQIHGQAAKTEDTNTLHAHTLARAGVIHRVLIVENMQCLHLLPHTPHTIAILGAGLDVQWMQASWLSTVRIGYWGDMDFWGLRILAAAMQHQPHTQPLLMDRHTFDSHKDKAVADPSTAVTPRVDKTGATDTAETHPNPRTAQQLPTEQAQLLQYLLSQKRGRLEQEFLKPENVSQAIATWLQN